MPDQEQARASHARLRKAAERLYEDIRLRDALTDEEAQRVLSWAYGRLERAVEHTKEMPEEEAMPIIEERSERVERVVRRVNAIMNQFSQTAEGERSTSLTHFVQTMRHAEEGAKEAEDAPTTERETAPESERTVTGTETLDRASLFEHLMNLITAREEAE